MANHEFGIMQNQPMNKERFDEYEPNKYDCIVVDDNFIEQILIVNKYFIIKLNKYIIN